MVRHLAWSQAAFHINLFAFIALASMCSGKSILKKKSREYLKSMLCVNNWRKPTGSPSITNSRRLPRCSRCDLLETFRVGGGKLKNGKKYRVDPPLMSHWFHLCGSSSVSLVLHYFLELALYQRRDWQIGGVEASVDQSFGSAERRGSTKVSQRGARSGEKKTPKHKIFLVGS